jgi:hypothetical protein
MRDSGSLLTILLSFANYKWMLIPMIIMHLGIYRDYWGDFSDNA